MWAALEGMEGRSVDVAAESRAQDPARNASAAASNATGQTSPMSDDVKGELYLLKVASFNAEVGGKRHLVATSLSNFSVRVYEQSGSRSQGSLRLVCGIAGHEAPVTDLLFLPDLDGPGAVHLLTSSEDGTVRTWDVGRLLRGGAGLGSILGPGDCVDTKVCDGRRSPVWSISASASGELLAAATLQGVLIWRKACRASGRGAPQVQWKKAVALEESFCDVVTQVLFHPRHSSATLGQHQGGGRSAPIVLAACGEDGLVCLFDLNRGPDEDENLLAVLNAESSVAQVGFFGPSGSGDGHLWCRTNDEAFVAWDWALACASQGDGGEGDVAMTGGRDEQSELCRLRDARRSLSESLRRAGVEANVDYLVDCHWDTSRAELRVCAGTGSGGLYLFQVAVESFDGARRESVVRFVGAGGIRAQANFLGQGHASVVRSMDSSGAPGGYLTCGEDGRLCTWWPSQRTGGCGAPKGRLGLTGGGRYKPY